MLVVGCLFGAVRLLRRVVVRRPLRRRRALLLSVRPRRLVCDDGVDLDEFMVLPLR